MKYRTEFKYVCHNTDLELAENKISKVLNIDKHTDINRNKYRVHSLYFDDFNNRCMFDNDMGVGTRFKYRIRYYDDNLEYIVIEKKVKRNGLGYKKSTQINLNILKDILNEEYSEVFWSSEDRLLKEFCVSCMKDMFRPKAIIDYERTAYVEPISNIRITFDRSISGSREVDKFLIGNYTKHPLMECNKNLLEIKFDEILPSYIKQCVQNKSLQQTTFSKYYLCRSLIERN